MNEIDPNQINQAVIIQEEFGTLLSRLDSEGFHYHALIAGAACALANSLILNGGPERAAAWFRSQADNIEHFAKAEKPN